MIGALSVSNPDEIRGAATAVELITDTDVLETAVVETERNSVAISVVRRKRACYVRGRQSLS